MPNAGKYGCSSLGVAVRGRSPGNHVCRLAYDLGVRVIELGNVAILCAIWAIASGGQYAIDPVEGSQVGLCFVGRVWVALHHALELLADVSRDLIASGHVIVSGERY